MKPQTESGDFGFKKYLFKSILDRWASAGFGVNFFKTGLQ